MKSNSHIRVLVIDDDTAIRATLVDLLELNDFTILQAVDGNDGFAQAKSSTPDVILTDLHMPGLDGFELIKALRAEEQTRSIPIIMISASVEPERMRYGMDLGADDFIVKPFTEDQVLQSIKARLEKKTLLDELDAFAHTVAHDLKNPIAVLMMRAELLDATWEKSDDATKRKHVTEITVGATRLANIVDELLVLAGVHRQKVETQAIDTALAAAEALRRVDNLVQKSGAHIEQPAAWPSAFGHAPWVVEIWTNYLSNALKYGGSPPRVQLGADAVPARARVRFWVQDNGPGLTPEQQSRLFQEFSRLNDTRAKGHGLGLSIVRRIADKLGGQVGVESQPGSGSRFWFELPTGAPKA